MIISHSGRSPETELSQIQHRQLGFIDNSVDGTWRLDFERPIPVELSPLEQVDLMYRLGYFGEANQALAEQYGFSTPEEVLGFRLENFLPRDLPASVPLLLRLVEAEYKAHQWETIEKDRFGNEKYFVNNCIGEICDGKLICLWGTAVDITEQRHLEKQILMQSAVFEQIPDGCVIVEVSSEKIVYVNQAFTEITGYAQVDFPDRKLSFLQGKDTDKSVVSKMRETIAQGQSFFGELLNYKKDGTPFWNLMRISPIRNSERKLTHYVGILSDITEQKTTQEQLHQQRIQLAHINRVSTMGEITAALAHQLNQPLAAILSNAQAALRYINRDIPEIDEIRDILVDIVADDKRAAETIRHIKSLVVKESVKFEPLDINKVVRDVIAISGNSLTGRRVDVQTRLAKDLSVVQGNPTLLQQVVLNLVMNALQELQNLGMDGRRIEISTRNLGNDAVEIAIADSGLGIKEEIMSEIFKPFCTTKAEGTGMGLAISRTITESHGGRINVENRPSGGAVFYVILPVKQ